MYQAFPGIYKQRTTLITSYQTNIYSTNARDDFLPRHACFALENYTDKKFQIKFNENNK